MAARRANDSDLLKRWLSRGVQNLGEQVMEERRLGCFNPLLTQDEAQRLVDWQLEVSLESSVITALLLPVINITGTNDSGHQVEQ